MAKKKVVIKKVDKPEPVVRGVVKAIARRAASVQEVAKDYDIKNVSKVYVSRNRFVVTVLNKLASLMKGSVSGNSVVIGGRTIPVIADDSVFKNLPMADSRGIAVTSVSNQNVIFVVDVNKFIK